MKIVSLIWMGLMGVSGATFAIQPGPSSPSQGLTEAWLQLQPSGKAASTIPQPSTPIERDLSAQRWVDSYQHPIPEFFEQKKGGSVSSGGGGN
jgi:hypothetical protein